MNNLQKTHTLKVIKESFVNPIVFIEYLPEQNIYITNNRLEIPEQVRELFFKNAIVCEDVSKQIPVKKWTVCPK